MDRQEHIAANRKTRDEARLPLSYVLSARLGGE